MATRAAPITLAAAALALGACAEQPVVREPDRLIELELTDYRIEPFRVRAPKGRLTFRVRNAGRLAHNLEVRGPGGRTRLRISTLLPGRSAAAQVRLPRGEWVLLCAVGNHEELGQHAELVTR